MKKHEVYGSLIEMGYPVAYSHFGEGEVPEAPFIVYYFPETSNFAADGKVYMEISKMIVELYTDKKDLDAEKKVEDWFQKNDLFYDKTESYIESEKWIQVVFAGSI